MGTYLPHCRHHLCLEPRVIAEPAAVAGRGVDERQISCRQKTSPILDGIAQACFAPGGKIMRLGVLADQQRKPDIRELGQDLLMPSGRAFRARREIAALALTGIAEPHRHDREAGLVVELVPGNTQPIAQAVTGGIVPGNAGRVNPAARRLTDDQDSGRRIGYPQNRVRAERKMGRTLGTGPDPRQQIRERLTQRSYSNQSG